MTGAMAGSREGGAKSRRSRATFRTSDGAEVEVARFRHQDQAEAEREQRQQCRQPSIAPRCCGSSRPGEADQRAMVKPMPNAAPMIAMPCLRFSGVVQSRDDGWAVAMVAPADAGSYARGEEQGQSEASLLGVGRGQVGA